MDTQLQADRFGLTDGAASTLNLIGSSGEQLAQITGHPLAAIGGDLLVDAAAIGRSSRLPELIRSLPYLGPMAEREIADIVRRDPDAKVLEFTRDALGSIKDETIVLTWKNGRLIEVKYPSGMVLSESDKQLAAMAGVYADLNLLPDEKKKVGEVWSMSAAKACQFFNIGDADVDDDVKGVVTLTRNKDVTEGEIAALVGAGKGSYTSPRKNLDFTIESLNAEIHLKDGNRFVSKVRSDGRFGYGTISDPDSPLQGVVFKTQPSFTGEYTCENVADNPQ
jgi:hypothetical protein